MEVMIKYCMAAHKPVDMATDCQFSRDKQYGCRDCANMHWTWARDFGYTTQQTPEELPPIIPRNRFAVIDFVTETD